MCRVERLGAGTASGGRKLGRGMAQDGQSKRDATQRSLGTAGVTRTGPPRLPEAPTLKVDPRETRTGGGKPPPPPLPPVSQLDPLGDDAPRSSEVSQRRASRKRTAAPARGADTPSRRSGLPITVLRATESMGKLQSTMARTSPCPMDAMA